MITVKLICDKCEKEFVEEKEHISDINWYCPKCKSKEDVFIINYEDTDNNNKEIVIGRGGCGKQKTW